MWRFASYGGGLFVPVKDASAGKPGGTYGGGRYLVDTVKGADLGTKDGALVLDLNFAYNPSCAYDPAWACPLAQPGSTVGVEIPVGERALARTCDHPAPRLDGGVRHMSERDLDEERRLRRAAVARHGALPEAQHETPYDDTDLADADVRPEADDEDDDLAARRMDQKGMWVEFQIRKAMERGEFDNLPGAGKPLHLPDRHDPDWWVKRLIEREKISGVRAAGHRAAPRGRRARGDHRPRGAGGGRPPGRRGVQPARGRGPPAAAGRPAGGHPAARRRRRGGRLARAPHRRRPGRPGGRPAARAGAPGRGRGGPPGPPLPAQARRSDSGPRRGA